MAIPHILPAPPRVTQDPARCWAAAYECFTRATATNLNISPGSGDDLVRWFESGRGLVTSAGRATDPGVRLMGDIGMMRMRRYPGRRVTARLIDGLLDGGYIYCAYYWGSGNGHAVIIYGVDRSQILFMDPAPGRGLVRESHNFFARESHHAILGTSLLVTLSRGIAQSFAGLGPPSVAH